MQLFGLRPLKVLKAGWNLHLNHGAKGGHGWGRIRLAPRGWRSRPLRAGFGSGHGAGARFGLGRWGVGRGVGGLRDGLSLPVRYALAVQSQHHSQRRHKSGERGNWVRGHASVADVGLRVGKARFAQVQAQAMPTSSEMERYFPTSSPPLATTTTTLLVPLAPTPTGRMPLPHPHSSSHPLLPLAETAAAHHTHAAHARRVSALFSALDGAGVWADGRVAVDAYALGGGDAYALGGGDVADAACTVLRVTFRGWTEAEVRGVIGERGTGWCAIEEVCEMDSEGEDARLTLSEEEDVHSIMSDSRSGISSDDDISFGSSQPDIVSTSFVLPTLDFSASASQSAPIPQEPVMFLRTASELGADYHYHEHQQLMLSSSFSSLLSESESSL